MTPTVFYDVVASPVGKIFIGVNDRGLSILHYPVTKPPARGELGGRLMRTRTKTRDVRRQLRLYFDGRLRRFDLPLDLQGTPFQMAVWRALLEIPYGTTVSYGELARRVGRPGAARAVGMANHRNRIGIVIPCHRVVGADGGLTGYAAGLDIKRQLLELECTNTLSKR